jgi:cold shock CspA family protein
MQRSKIIDPDGGPDRLLGTLIHIFPAGYGFLHVRDGQPDYFIHRRQVKAAQHWRKNQEFFFTPEPPLEGKASPRAGDPVPLVPAIGRKQTSHTQVVSSEFLRAEEPHGRSRARKNQAVQCLGSGEVTAVLA